MSKQIDRLKVKGKGGVGSVLNVIYPPRCLTCTELTDHGASLCADCWSNTTFIAGAICDVCGAPLPGVSFGDKLKCDTCLRDPPHWDAGRAAVVYNGGGRRVVLSLKHGDRLDMVKPLANWMARSGDELLQRADIIVPVPLHWRRLLKRKYNQSAELARQLSKISGVPDVPDLLIRNTATPSQDGLNRTERYENQRGVFEIRKHRKVAKNVLLIDDVMTTGATLSVCADALRFAGAERIDALVLARVAQQQ